MLDFNDLERHARRLIDVGRFADAIAIYLFMGDDDPSQDAGYLAWRVGQCREAIGELHAAKRWYGIALGENPGVEKYQDALRRLEGVGSIRSLRLTNVRGFVSEPAIRTLPDLNGPYSLRARCVRGVRLEASDDDWPTCSVIVGTGVA